RSGHAHPRTVLRFGSHEAVYLWSLPSRSGSCCNGLGDWDLPRFEKSIGRVCWAPQEMRNRFEWDSTLRTNSLCASSCWCGEIEIALFCGRATLWIRVD